LLYNTAINKEKAIELFNEIDIDKSKELDFKEFLTLVEKLGIVESCDDAKHLFAEYDSDNSKYFITIMYIVIYYYYYYYF
jgi:Ca2+-binding EF-hand superfamily protein